MRLFGNASRWLVTACLVSLLVACGDEGGRESAVDAVGAGGDGADIGNEPPPDDDVETPADDVETPNDDVDPPPTDSGAPKASIHFPLPVSSTTNTLIPVRGTAHDVDGSEIVSVMVEGMPATLILMPPVSR